MCRDPRARETERNVGLGLMQPETGILAPQIIYTYLNGRYLTV